MGIGLSIVFTGLCALVTDADGGSAQVLLVDAQGIGEVGGVVLPEHAPTLVVALDGLANAETSRPTRVVMAWPAAGSIEAADDRTLAGQVGLWDLTGSEVRIRVQRGAESGLRVFRSNGTSSWPEPPRNGNDTDAWRDIRFVADMGPLAGDGRIDPALVAESSGVERALPRAVAARVLLDSGLIEAGPPSQKAYRDDMFEFRDKSGAPRLRQALTDTIRWSLATGAGTVLIEIVPAAGGEVRRLVFSPRATTHTVFISNMPAQNSAIATHHAVSDEEMAALHFGAYYKLLRHEPANQPLPHVWLPASGQTGTGMGDRMFCPPAAFTRD